MPPLLCPLPLPGTGKTTTLVSLITALAEAARVRQLVCAPTNAAIAEVGGRLLSAITRGRSVRTALEAAAAAPVAPEALADSAAPGALASLARALRPLHPSDVVLVASRSVAAAVAEGPLAAADLEGRAERLLGALGLMGWRQRVDELAAFLLSAPDLFWEVLAGQQVDGSSDDDDDGRAGGGRGKAGGGAAAEREWREGFWEWARGGLAHRAGQLLGALRALEDDAPRAILAGGVVPQVIAAVRVLRPGTLQPCSQT